MSQIISLSGRIGSGKDTVCKIIQNLMPATPWEQEWENRKWAAKLKQIASLLTNVPVEMFEDQDFKASYMGNEWSYLPPISEEILTDGIGLAFKKMTYREFLQRLGTEGMRNGVHQNTWINALFSDFTKESRWIITDTRFENEVDYIQSRGGKIIKIIRHLPRQGYPILENLHPSETALDNHRFDYVLDNHGTLLELTQQVKKMLIALDIMPL